MLPTILAVFTTVLTLTGATVDRDANGRVSFGTLRDEDWETRHRPNSRGVRFRRPYIRLPNQRRPVIWRRPQVCEDVDCEDLLRAYLAIDEFSRHRRRHWGNNMRRRLCCVESRRCPVCQNGGTPWEARCACVTGFTGSCCESEIDCGSVGSFPAGQISSIDTTYATVLTFTCNEGYRRHGDARRVCQLDGTWSGSQPTCSRIRCDHPGEPEHGSASASGSRLDYGTVLTFSCDQGYVRSGDSQMTCTEVGRWTGTVPTCRAVTCPTLATPYNGHKQDGGHVYGSTTTFSCAAGFEVVGPSSRTCQADGTWSETQPTCEPSPCPPIDPPENGMSEGQHMSYGNTVNFKCLAGYFLTGSDSVTCREDQTWSSALPVCTVCPADHYQPLLTAATACTACPINTHTVSAVNNAQIACVCDEGWRGPPGGPCERVTCPRPQAPEDGFIGLCELVSGSQCEFDCDPGFIRVSGDVTRTCGTDSSWSGVELVCNECPIGTYADVVRRVCLRCPANSHTDGEYTSVESCICDAGFQRGGQGQEHCIDIDECSTDNGGCEQHCDNTPGGFKCTCPNPGFIIDGDDPTQCVPENQCTAHPPPQHGGYVCSLQRNTNTQRCQVKCDNGYEHALRPNLYEECGPTTDWIWSFVLNGIQKNDISGFICREEFFPGLTLESSVFFFVSQCAALTDGQLDAVRTGFRRLLEIQGLCTTSGLLRCHLEDTSVHCGENGDHQGIVKRDTESQMLVIDYTLAIEGMSRSQSYCDLTCATPAECERCLWLYKSNATRLLEQEARRVRRLLVQEERPATTTTTTTTTTRAPPAAMLAAESRGAFHSYDAPPHDVSFAMVQVHRPMPPPFPLRMESQAAAGSGGLNFGGVTLRLQGVSVSSANLHCGLGTTNIDGSCVA